MPYSTTELLELLKKIDHNPKKSLGQNFLINEEVCERITKWVENASPELVVEVGPGLGALTKALAKLEKELILIELDKKFCQLWRDQGLNVIEADALDVDWEELTRGRTTTLVSNLPYQISSRIVVDRSVEPFGVNRMILMFQKEVAERIATKNGGKEYGLLSVIAQSAWKIRKFSDVGPKDFYPPPQVGSRILEFERIEPKVDMTKFLPFAKAAFAQRRKMLSKNLSTLYDRDSVNSALEQIGVKITARAENLSVEEFQSLFLILNS